MSSNPQTPAPTPAAPNVSVLQKIESWFHKAKLKLEGGLSELVGPQVASELESAFEKLLKTAEGQIAQKVVTEMADVATGQVNVQQAVSATIAAAAAAGKTLSQSAATALVAAAQQKVLSLAQSGS